jgi:hypothetical protein
MTRAESKTTTCKKSSRNQPTQDATGKRQHDFSARADFQSNRDGTLSRPPTTLIF